MSGGFGHGQNLTFALDFGALTGVTIAPSATINTVGSWVSLGSLNGGCAAFKLSVIYQNNAQADYACQVDIGVGASGSQVALITNINMSVQPAGLGQCGIFQRLVPVSLPPNTQIWARSAVNIASFTGTVKVWLTPFDNGFPYVGECTGVDTIGSIGPGRGTVITAGTNLSGVKGSYTALNTTAGTLRDLVGFWLCFDLAHNASNESGDLIDIAIGASGSQKIILPDLLIYQGAVESPSDFDFVPIPIPAGSQIWARAANVAPATTFGITLYGCY